MKNELRAVAYWEDRKESIEECAERLMRFIKELEHMSPYLAQWYETARTKRAALKKPIEADHGRLRDLLDEGRNRDDTPRHRVIEELGFHVMLWSGEQPDGDGVSLDVICGAYGAFSGCNHVNFVFSTNWLDTDGAVELVRAMVSCWSPAHAAVCSREALWATGGQVETPMIDWVFFHRLPRTGDLSPPSRVAFELDGGECIVVQDVPIRPEDEHERARVRGLARQLGLAPEEALPASRWRPVLPGWRRR